MKALLVSVFALGTMTSIGLAAEPVTPSSSATSLAVLTDDQMDGITAARHYKRRGVRVNAAVAVNRNDIDITNTNNNTNTVTNNITITNPRTP
jgi:hypothetical protein